MTAVRILHVVSRSQRRGAELVAVELAGELDALGHIDRVRALAPGFDGTVDPDVPALTARRDGGALALVRAAHALRRDIAAQPVDVVLAHGGRAVEAAVLARRRGRPLVVWQRILGFPPSMQRGPARLRWRAIVRRVDAAVALTADLEDELRALGFSRPVWRIANFRDPRPFAGLDRDTAGRDLRAELGVPAGTPLLGFVGHLTAQKRPDRAVEMLAAVAARADDADDPHAAPCPHLVIAGDGPMRADVEREAERRGLTDRVHLLGSRADVPHLLAGIDVFVLTSDDEGLPGVLIEAAMAGCAIVTVPVGGVREIVDDGTTGVVAASVGTGALTDAVVTLLGDPAARRRLGDAARAASGRFGSEAAAREYDARLAGLAASAGIA